MKLIMHVGHPKTGSTSIQSLLNINNDILEKKSYLYKTDKFNHQPIIGEFLQNNDIQAIAKFVQEQKKVAAEKNCHTIILSSESFFEMDKEFIKIMLDFFNMPTRIIVYLKRQDTFVESSWKQWHFKNKKFTDFLDYVAKAKVKSYFETLNEWSSLVGEKNITVIAFEKRSFPDGLLRNFLMHIGIFGTEADMFNYDIPKTMYGTNPGLSPLGLKFAYMSRDLATSVTDYRIENFIHKYLDDVFQKEDFQSYGLFSPEKRSEFMKMYEDDNNKIASVFLDKKVFFEDTLDILENKKEITLDDLAKVIMEIGIKMDEKIKKLNNGR